MRLAIFILIILTFVIISEHIKTLKFPSNRKIPDKESKPSHFAVLNNEALKPLPKQFSICSSLLIELFRDYLTFFSMMNKNNKFWFAVNIAQDLNTENYNFSVSAHTILQLWETKGSAYGLGNGHICVSV